MFKCDLCFWFRTDNPPIFHPAIQLIYWANDVIPIYNLCALGSPLELYSAYNDDIYGKIFHWNVNVRLGVGVEVSLVFDITLPLEYRLTFIAE